MEQGVSSEFFDSLSNLSHAAVNAELRAGDEAAFIAGKK